MALPTAITLFSNNIGVSAATRTFFPHHTTCFENTDLPSITNGAASLLISIQFSRKVLLWSSIWAKSILIAKLPLILKVQRSFPLWETVLILPVFRDKITSISFGKYFEEPGPNNASSDCWSFKKCSTIYWK